MVHVQGICGSPIKDSNTEIILKEALGSIENDEVRTDLFPLYNKKIEDCRHCNWCMGKQQENHFCALKDDMEGLYPKVIEAHALIVASPVYLGRMSGITASCLDRLRCLHYGRYYQGGMKYKVGAAIAISWFRNSGVETTLLSIHWAFLTYQMVIAVPGSLSTFGGAGSSSLSGTGEFDPRDKHQILKDDFGLKTARAVAQSTLELLQVIKHGKNTLNIPKTGS